MAKTTIYGISNCDTIKKAKTWLTEHKVDFVFHDYRKQGVDADQLKHWSRQLGWESMLNKRGTTWRQLPENAKSNIDEDSAIKIMLENPAIIKRPLLDKDGALALGFKPAQYQTLFGLA